MTARVAVVVFPGTNCEHDVVGAVSSLGMDADLVWHDHRDLSRYDAVVIPGGFAHGDYLRPGAIARFSAVMEGISKMAASGGPVLGICNGFQVLTEGGLLPGALVRNRSLRFVCRDVSVRVEPSKSPLSTDLSGRVLRLPVNHFAGNYVCDAATLDALRSEERVVMRYVDNPNGSIDDIAGICNEVGNVVGMMPHPERACDPLLGSQDGEGVLGSFLRAASLRTPVL